jgi:hypothetical protein
MMRSRANHDLDLMDVCFYDYKFNHARYRKLPLICRVFISATDSRLNVLRKPLKFIAIVTKPHKENSNLLEESAVP